MFFNININIVVNYLLWCFCVVSLNQNFKKMPKQVILYFMCVYVCTCISLSYHLTFYYQLISLLNTKNNLNVVFLFILIYCGLLNRKKNYLLFFMFVLLLSFVTFTTSNWKNVILHISIPNTVNINLLNGLLLIHPAILYMFYINYISLGFCNTKLKFKKPYKNTNLNKVYVFLLLSSNTSLVLGCWWAEQELGWGGWWNWDFVELIALNFFLISLMYFHKSNKVNDFFLTNNLVFYSILFVSIIVVRFNIINSIHNFINVGSQNQYLLIYIYILIIFILKVILNLKNLEKPYKLTFLINSSFFLYLTVYTFYILFLYNFFLKNFSFLNLNTIFNVKFLYSNIIIIFLLWYFFKKNNQKVFLLLFVVIYYIVGYYTNALFINMILLLVYVYLFYVSGLIKFKIDVWKIHATVLTLFYVSTQQIYIYNFIPDIYIFTKIVVWKLNTDIISIYDYTHTIIWNNDLKLLENVFKVGNFLSSANWKPIFEKNLFFFKNNFIELFGYNLQFLIQLSGIVLYFLIIIPIIFFIKFNKVNILICL